MTGIGIFYTYKARIGEAEFMDAIHRGLDDLKAGRVKSWRRIKWELRLQKIHNLRRGVSHE